MGRQGSGQSIDQWTEGKARFDAILAAAVDAIVVIDTAGIIHEFNPAASALFGYRREEALGHNVNILMPEPYHGQHDSFIANYLDTGQAKIIGIGREVTGRRKNGEQFPMDLAVGEIRHGSIVGFVGLIRDITARRAVEEQLRQREAELSLTFEQAPMAIATADLDGCILTANPALCQMVGYSEDELRQTSFSALTHPDEADKATRQLQRLGHGEIDRYTMTTRYVAKGGKLIHGALYNGLVRSRDGQPLFMVAEIVDQTAEVEAAHEAALHRERLAQVGRLNTLGEVAAGIAHEINQPLTAVANYAKATRRLVASKQCDDSVVLDALGKIADQAERAGQVIERLRRFLKRRDVEFSQVDCNTMIREVRPLAEMDLSRLGLHLQLTLEPGLPAVHGDIVQLQQVILNLVRNAVDAMSGRRSADIIEITTVRRGRDWIAIHVDDSGPGIAPAVADELFEPFMSSKPDGLGLGLAISRSIVDAHGGELRHAPRDAGGTRFTLVLPVGNAHAS